MSNPQCGSCHGEYGKCIHTAGLTLPAYVSTPAQSSEPLQKDYIPGRREMIETADEKERYAGEDVARRLIYGAKGDRGERGETGIGIPGRDGRDAKLTLGKVVVADEAKAVLEDTSSGQVLHLWLPRGERGATGVGIAGQDGKSIVGPAGKNGVDGQSIVGPAGKNGVDGRPGCDADPTQICAQATKFLEDAFHGFKAEVRSALSDTVVAQLKSSGVIDANGKAILIPGPQGIEGLRGKQGIPGDISMADAQSERTATRVAREEIKLLAAELRAEILKELEAIKNA